MCTRQLGQATDLPTETRIVLDLALPNLRLSGAQIRAAQNC